MKNLFLATLIALPLFAQAGNEGVCVQTSKGCLQQGYCRDGYLQLAEGGCMAVESNQAVANAPAAVSPVVVDESINTMSRQEVLDAIRALSATDENQHDAIKFADFINRQAGNLINMAFEKNGRPTAVLVGNQGSGGFIVSYTKGAGRVLFKGQSVEEARKIYWRGAGAGFGADANLGRTIVLIYNDINYNGLLQHFVGGNGDLHFVAGASTAGFYGNHKKMVFFNAGVGFGAKIEGATLRFSSDEQWVPGVDF